VMVEALGTWAMELMHVLTGFNDIRDLLPPYADSPHDEGDIGNFDEMAFARGMHPTAYTKVGIEWLDRSTIVQHGSGAASYALHAIGLAQPPPTGRWAAVQIGSQVPYLMVEARLMVDQFESRSQLEPGIPSEGVIVYRVQTSNPLGFPQNNLIPIFLLTTTALTPGMAFTSDSGVTVSVTATLFGGFSVSIIASGWSSFFRIDVGFAKGRSPVTVVARNPDHLDLFVTGTDGGIYSAYWDGASGWSSFFRIDVGFATTGGTSVAAIARIPDHLDLFVTGTDGGIYSAYWDSASGWSSFFRIDAGFAKGRSPVTVVARIPDHLDLFVTGTDGGIYSAYWDR